MPTLWLGASGAGDNLAGGSACQSLLERAHAVYQGRAVYGAGRLHSRLVPGKLARMRRRLLRIAVLLALVFGAWIAFVVHARATFPSDRTPEGAYARIVLAISEGHPRDCFAYLETQAQWAAYTIRDYRSKAASKVQTDYPEPERSRMLDTYAAEASAPDGADIWQFFAERKGFVARLRKDLSGVQHVEVVGERATVQTARGTRYTFRKRENGIWGLTSFTGELLAEAEKAARDYEVVERAARDYQAARGEAITP